MATDKPSPQEIKKEVLRLLNKETEWQKRYKKYIDEVNVVLANPKANYRKFRTPEQLSRYSSVSRRDGKTYDLRYEGKSMAVVRCDKNEKIYLTPNEKNLSDIQFSEKYKKGNEWNSEYSKELRSFFKHINNGNDSQPEHKLENKLLRHFISRDKSFHILPVQLYDCFFQMPTPLKASNHKQLPTYAKQSGGGIDILARVTPIKRLDNEYSRLCVMEVKDQNVQRESQADAMGQAVAYAVFIAKLLRSKSGQDWYDFLMKRKEKKKNGNVPENLHIDVVTVMTKGNTDEFCNEDLDVSELNTTLHCHTLYFDDKKFNKGIGEIVFTEESTYLNKVKK